MDTTNKKLIKASAYLLLASLITQTIYTILFISFPEGKSIPWPMLWGIEILIFVALTAFSSAAMLKAKQFQLGWSAITFSAIFNLVQASIGATLFGPFKIIATQNETLAPLAGGIVAFAFVVYYSAKFLLGFGALAFGLSKQFENSKNLKLMTLIAGIIAMSANGIQIVFGRDGLIPSAVAGSSGMIATALVVYFLISIAKESTD